jgi:hypothetical protein
MKTIEIIKCRYGLNDDEAVRFIILVVLGKVTAEAAIKIIRR